MNTRRASIVLSLAIALAGCASRPDTVVFVTKSSLGLDVEQTPPSASIAYDRVEGYFGPRYESGAVPPVVAVFMTNGQLLDRRVKQLYATGDAARHSADARLRSFHGDLAYALDDALAHAHLAPRLVARIHVAGFARRACGKRQRNEKDGQ